MNATTDACAFTCPCPAPCPCASSTPVVDGDRSKRVGANTGFCKWFNNAKSFGFITLQSDEPESDGIDVFVHRTSIKPLTCRYKTLKEGEYVNFDIVSDEKGRPKALNVTGIKGGPLMCDVERSRSTYRNRQMMLEPQFVPEYSAQLMRPSFVRNMAEFV